MEESTMSIERGVKYEAELRKKDKEVEKNRYRAGTILTNFAEIHSKESGKSFSESFELQRLKYPGLSKSYEHGDPLPVSGEESEVVARFYNLKSTTSRRIY
jgi:hypothetical protein